MVGDRDYSFISGLVHSELFISIYCMQENYLFELFSSWGAVRNSDSFQKRVTSKQSDTKQETFLSAQRKNKLTDGYSRPREKLNTVK